MRYCVAQEKEKKKRLEKERLEAEERAKKLEEERLQKVIHIIIIILTSLVRIIIILYHSSCQLHEEEELKRQEREAKLFADLGAQGVPTFGLEVYTYYESRILIITTEINNYTF